MDIKKIHKVQKGAYNEGLEPLLMQDWVSSFWSLGVTLGYISLPHLVTMAIPLTPDILSHTCLPFPDVAIVTEALPVETWIEM